MSGKEEKIQGIGKVTGKGKLIKLKVVKTAGVSIA